MTVSGAGAIGMDGATDGVLGGAAGEAEIRITTARDRAVQQRRSAPVEFGATKRAAFFEALAATCNVALSAQIAGAHVSGLYRARRRDASFAARWDEALAIGYDRLEAEALRYAVERIGDAPIDPDAAADAVAGRGAVAALTRGQASDTDLRFVLAILGRYQAAAEGRRRAARTGVATQEETDARLTELLARVTRRVRARKAAAGATAGPGGDA